MDNNECMVVVTDATVMRVPSKVWDVEKFNDYGYLRINDGKDAVSVRTVRETIRGQCFENSRGESVYIGIAKDVQKAIGIPLDVFGRLKRDIEVLTITVAQLRSRSAMYQRRIAAFNDKSYFKRLWHALLGRDI